MYAAETVAKMKAANPRLEVVAVEAGHDLAWENPAALLAAVRGFLEEKTREHERG
jgi:pimeloyl-ACP methyl ester carboxylesterase